MSEPDVVIHLSSLDTAKIRLGHGHRWFLRAWRFGDWYGRLWGYGFGVRDHREHGPLFSERKGRGGHYFHLGDYCIRTYRRVPRD